MNATTIITDTFKPASRSAIIFAIRRSELSEFREKPYFVNVRTVAAIHLAPKMASYTGDAFEFHRLGTIDLVDAEVLGGFITIRGDLDRVLVALPEE